MDNTPFPVTIEIATSDPTIDISNNTTVICCSDSHYVDVKRDNDGDTFASADSTSG